MKSKKLFVIVLLVITSIVLESCSCNRGAQRRKRKYFKRYVQTNQTPIEFNQKPLS